MVLTTSAVVALRYSNFFTAPCLPASLVDAQLSPLSTEIKVVSYQQSLLN